MKIFVIEYSDGCYYAGSKVDEGIDIVTDIEQADTFAKSTAEQLVRNETLGITLYDENGKPHSYKVLPKVISKE